ncbi:MAG: PAS domain S-box protein [Candidatus Gracilibacteria bacterium]|nr:PAS domain S-box protein [Candidatus Gracilibacteria bacterium]
MFKLDAELKRVVGEKDFTILKNLKKEDKEAIVKAKNSLRLANRSGNFFWLGDKNHNTIYVNKFYRDATGCSLKEMVELKYKSDHFFTNESKKTIEKHHKLRAKGISSQYEGDFLTKDGAIIPLLINGLPTESGGSIGVFRDLLIMNKLSEQDQILLKTIGNEDFKIIKRLVSNQDQKIIIEVSPAIKIANAWNQAFWVGNANHETIYCNQVYRKLTEYSLEETLGKQSDFCFDQESKKTIEKHHKLRKKGVTSQYEATYISKSGKKTPILIIGSPTSAQGTFGFHINMTEIKALATSKQITDQIVRHSSEAIVVLNKNLKITVWNSGASKIFGYKEEEVLHKNINLLSPPESLTENQEIIKEVDSKKYIRNYETRGLTKSGDMIDVNISLTKVLDEKNKFIGYLAIYKDISTEKKTNIELQKRFEAIQDAYKELGIQKRQIDYLYEISNSATSNCTLSSLANLIISAICLLTKCDGATLRLYNKSKDSLNLEACIGVSQKWLTKNQFPLKGSLAEEAIKTARPLLIDNIDSSQKHKGVKLLKAHKFSTMILIPLLLPNKIVGTISLYSTDSSKFRFIETDFLENFGKQCAIALYVKQLTQPHFSKP